MIRMPVFMIPHDTADHCYCCSWLLIVYYSQYRALNLKHTQTARSHSTAVVVYLIIPATTSVTAPKLSYHTSPICAHTCTTLEHLLFVACPHVPHVHTYWACFAPWLLAWRVTSGRRVGPAPYSRRADHVLSDPRLRASTVHELPYA